jgi:hypothetical protein
VSDFIWNGFSLCHKYFLSFLLVNHLNEFHPPLLDVEYVTFLLLCLVVDMLRVWLYESKYPPFWNALDIYLNEVVFCYLGL